MAHHMCWGKYEREGDFFAPPLLSSSSIPLTKHSESSIQYFPTCQIGEKRGKVNCVPSPLMEGGGGGEKKLFFFEDSILRRR